jgi:hypothetical protein
MKMISSKYLFSYKIGPFLFIGFVAVFIVLVLINGAYKKEPMALIVPCLMAGFGYYFVKIPVRDLVDQVYDCGDFLLVRKHGEEDRIPLSCIINVTFSMNVQPARITLALAHPGKFGPEISFALPPRIYINPLAKNEVAEDLIVRANKARARHAV